MNFSSISESRDRIRKSYLSRKKVPSRRGGVCKRPLTIGYCTKRQMTQLSTDERNSWCLALMMNEEFASVHSYVLYD